MEAEAVGQPRRQGLRQLALPSPGLPGLDIVRALHQTVISLRSALDSSREELRRFKESFGDFSAERYAAVVERLALENHVLRRKILSTQSEFSQSDAATSPPPPQAARLPPPALEDYYKDSSEQAGGTQMDTLSRDKVLAEDLPDAAKPTIRTRTASSSSSGSESGSESGAKNNETPKSQNRTHQGKSWTTNRDKVSSRGQQQHSTRKRRASTSASTSTGKDGDAKDVVENPVTTMSDARPEDKGEDDRFEVPDKDHHPDQSSLKSVSDGENSVFSDNPDQQQVGQERKRQNESSKPLDQSENESEELDDIELIFTTDETCRDLGLQEDLVSITETESWQQQQQQQHPPQAEVLRQPVLLEKYNTKSAENESQRGEIYNGEKTSSVDEAASSQSSSIDREESVDRFDESSNARLNKMWSQCSVLVETDISKCGVLEEPEHSARHAVRRNTLAAPPAAATTVGSYRPIIHREALAAASRRKSSAPLRPVMDRSSGSGAAGGGGARRESSAQTDISALPAQWRSESYLAHKVAHTFTTLPSKFALPAGMPGRLRLSDKTREARRVMLSDISFTSMVPELSRSADHLCHEPHAQSCFSSRGCALRTPEAHRRESLGSPAGALWPRCNLATGLPSPCECRLSTELYSSRYRGSLSSIPSPGLDLVAAAAAAAALGPSRRHSWRANAASFDAWRVPAVTATSRTPKPMWSSVPSSPTHVHPPAASCSARTCKNHLPKRTRSRVTFQECPMTRGSLPNLQTDLLAGGDNSGDSTESLIDEAEDYLRRSIDSMLTISSTGVGGVGGVGSDHYWTSRRHTDGRRRTRRYSEPDLIRDWHPPRDARPYLPKIPRDLKLDHLVKVISPEGRVLQGRVRYVGPVPGREDVYVGVELPYLNGTSDGTFHDRRFFDCEPDRAIFVPFKKVILAWCTT